MSRSDRTAAWHPEAPVLSAKTDDVSTAAPSEARGEERNESLEPRAPPLPKSHPWR